MIEMLSFFIFAAPFYSCWPRFSRGFLYLFTFFSFLFVPFDWPTISSDPLGGLRFRGLRMDEFDTSLGNPNPFLRGFPTGFVVT